MAHQENGPYSVLLVSGSEKGTAFFQKLLSPRLFAPVKAVRDAGEARRLLVSLDFSLVLINTPLPDEFGDQLAADLDSGYGCGVLLAVKAEMYEQLADKLADTGVLCLARPCSAQAVYRSVRLLAVMQQRIQALRTRLQGMQGKMEELRLVERAKWALAERLQLSEEQAHRAIEKRAMDGRITRRQAAEDILRQYGTSPAVRDGKETEYV